MHETKQVQQILEKNQARLKVFRESIRSQLTTLVKEIAAAVQIVEKIERDLRATETRIKEKRETISNQQEQLSQLREAGASIEAKIGGLYTKLSGQQKEISVLEATLMATNTRLETAEKELMRNKEQLTNKHSRLDKIRAQIADQKAEKDKELTQQRDTLEAAESQYQKIKDANPVASYLMTEGLEPPELEIIAILISKDKVSTDELKRAVKVPPAIASRILKELENKAIITITSKGQVSLAMTI